jgi:hypothetical protein
MNSSGASSRRMSSPRLGQGGRLVVEGHVDVAGRDPAEDRGARAALAAEQQQDGDHHRQQQPAEHPQ